VAVYGGLKGEPEHVFEMRLVCYFAEQLFCSWFGAFAKKALASPVKQGLVRLSPWPASRHSYGGPT